MQIHRSVRIGLRVLAGLVGGLCLLVGLTIVVLRSNWGGERLRRYAVTQVNEQIQGHLDIGRLVFGGNRVVVQDVHLLDPDGRFVASVARAEVDVALLGLLHQEVHIKAITVDTPVVDLVSAPGGTNLARATAPRKHTPPKPAQPKTSKEGWVIRLDRFDLAGGNVIVATAAETSPTGKDGGRSQTKAHLAELRVHVAARYATGNGNLDLTLSLDGQSAQAPAGPLHLTAETHVRGQKVKLAADGALLGGTLMARADVEWHNLPAAQAQLKVDVPAISLASYTWGPLRIEGQAQPGVIPTLALLLDLPGVTLRGNGGGPEGAANHGPAAGRFDFTARLTLSDLALTAKAVHAVGGGALAPLDGHGTVDVALGGPMAGAPTSWNGEVKVDVPRLVSGDTSLAALKLTARAQRLSADPQEATLALTIPTVRTGKTVVRGIDISADWKKSAITAAAKVASPEPVTLALAARMDDDRQGLSLTRMDLTYPGTDWALDSAALVHFGGDTVSLEQFSLSARDQTLAIDGRKEGQGITAHVALDRLRLEGLPALLVNPSLHVAGLLNVDVKASGTTANPRVVASVQLQHGRFRDFTRLGVKVDATLADQKVDGTLGVEAPFAALDAQFQVPTNVQQDPSAPFDLRLNVERLAIGDALRAAAAPTQADGRMTAHLHARGSLGDPLVDVTLTGKELQVTPSATAVKTPDAVDIGHGRLQVSYARKQARADLDFAASHGGTLRVDAGAHVDLSYPRVTEGLVVPKIPVHGKVTAKDLNVAWIAQFSDRVQALAGLVDADAKLAGTVGDPQFVGDVRWKNGKLIANAAAPATPVKGATAGRARRAGR